VSNPMISDDVQSTAKISNLPHGGKLCSLLVSQERSQELRSESRNWLSWDLTSRQICDLELLLNGGFSPLRGFLNRAAYERVCSEMRLPDGTLWPIPITLDVGEDFAGQLKPSTRVALRDEEGTMLAALTIEDVWRPDRRAEAAMVFGTDDESHPGVAYLMRSSGTYYVAGTIEGIQLPTHYDFKTLRLTPMELRAEFAAAGWNRVVAFQTRNPMHRAHWELTRRAAKIVDAKLLIHPVVGMTKPGDVDHFTRVRCYQSILRYAPGDSARLCLLPLAMRMGGPREAVWHAIIRRNFGCTHLIVGRDHAGPGTDSKGRPFYGPYDAQKLLASVQNEIGITMLPFNMMVYVEQLCDYVPENELLPNAKVLNISGTQLRQRLMHGREIPEWFTFPDIERELRRTHPPRIKQGVTVFFTGLSGAGKSTIANALLVKLLEMGGRGITLLDGDLVRRHLSAELGFSKEHRDLNIRRIGFVASEITKHGGIAICAPIAPYDAIRKEVRGMVERYGGFILVHITTPLEICEQRDRKGLYAKARAGVVKQFTGISDPYEIPEDAELRIETTSSIPGDAATQIIAYLRADGYLPVADAYLPAEGAYQRGKESAAVTAA
jgi:sulfate adenylyltransferase